MAAEAKKEITPKISPEIKTARALTWVDELRYEDQKRTKIEKNSLHNTRLYLLNSDKYKGLFAFDEFIHETIVIRCPPWTPQDKFRVHRITDADISHLAVALEQDEISPGIAMLDRIVDITARENAIHPARDYLLGLKWDGVERLGTWLTDYCKATRDNPEYLRAVGTTWLVGAATRILRPGSKLDGMLVLEGEPDAGKSLVLKELATFGGESYFTDAVTLDKLNDKDTAMILLGKVIVEFAELSGYNKREKEDIKRWVTMEVDEFRRPFGKRVERFPRQFVAAATHNPIGGWLTDPTGNRKFWPVLVGRKIDLEGIRRDREQLWAEAVHLAQNGFNLWLSEEHFKLASEAQEERRSYHPWTDDVISIVKFRDFVTVPEILKALGVDVRFHGSRESKDIASILMVAGWVQGRQSVHGKQQRGWVRKHEIHQAP